MLKFYFQNNSSFQFCSVFTSTSVLSSFLTSLCAREFILSRKLSMNHWPFALAFNFLPVIFGKVNFIRSSSLARSSSLRLYLRSNSFGCKFPRNELVFLWTEWISVEKWSTLLWEHIFRGEDPFKKILFYCVSVFLRFYYFWEHLA